MTMSSHLTARTTPTWLRNVGATPMKMGLDLSGGVHFLLEVDMDKALDARLKVYEGEVKSLLRKEKVRYRSLPQLGGAIQLGFSDDAAREEARVLVRKNYTDFEITPAELNGIPVLRPAMTWRKSTKSAITHQTEPDHGT